MATATEESEPVVKYDDFIDDRLDRTSFHLKTLDCVTGFIWLGLFVFGSLFALVLIDHWIVGLSFWARAISLIAIFGVATYLAVKQVIMPLVRSINPEYAALTVEQSHPEFKNGLINFLFFRNRTDQLREGVYHGIREQAASELGTVPIDSAVDRTPIIKLGYYFIALAAIWVGYILLSPKNPLQTVQRIAMPWRDISRPSQVDILDVTPGSVEIFRGQTVEVKVKIEGLKTDQTAEIQFTTFDGQLVDQHVPLVGKTGNVFTGALATSDEGIQQDLEYRIHAGDAISQRFEVHVTEAPHIVVDRVEFDYPAYVGQADEVVQGEGDIRAIEGTRVTVFGKANQPIKRGHIEFVTTAESNSPTSKNAPLRTSTNATDGNVKFSLRMNEARDAALYRAYRLHFTNDDGQTSVDAIEHAIEVIPDLRPVVQILAPDKRTIELPENSWTKIEVRAVDPDYQLSRVQLAARTRGRKLFQEKMLSTSRSSEWHTGQFTATYKFVPRDFGLKDGDVVEYLAMAEDNKYAIGQNKLAPNQSRTAKQYIRIVKADPLAEQPPKDEQQQNDPNQPQDQQTDDASDDAKGNEQQSSGNSKNETGEQTGEQQQQEGEEEGAEGSEAGEQQEEEEGTEGRQGEESGLQQNSETGGGDTEKQSQGGTPGDSNDANSDQSSGNNAGNQPSDSQGEKGNESGDPSDNSDQGSDPSDDSNSDPSANPSGESGESDAGGQQNGEQDNAGRGARDDEPLPSSGERDGEVVERIRDHMKEQGDLEEYEKKQKETQSDEGSDSESGSEGEQGESGEQSSSGDNEQQQTGNGGESEQGKQNNQSTDPNSDPSNSQSGEQNQQSEKGNESSSGEGGEEGSQGDQTGESGSNNTDSESGAEQKTGKSSESGESGTESQTGEGESAEDSEGQAGNSQSEQSAGDPSNGESQAGDSQEDSGNDTSEQQPNGEQQDSQNSGNNNSKQNDSPQNNSPNQDQTGNNPSGDSSQQSSDSEAGETDSNGEQSESSKKPPANKSTKPTGSANDGDRGEGGDLDGSISGDDANLEYAREATDMVLEYLKDQKQKPDQDLLDKLGWNQDDVDKFVRRWDQLKRKAKSPDGATQENKSKLDELLKGMGLEAPDAKLRRTNDRNDKQRDNRNTGRKRKVPADLLDPFRAFQRSLQQTK